MAFQGKGRGGEHIVTGPFVTVRKEGTELFPVYGILMPFSPEQKCQQGSCKITQADKPWPWQQVQNKTEKLFQVDLVKSCAKNTKGHPCQKIAGLLPGGSGRT